MRGGFFLFKNTDKGIYGSRDSERGISKERLS